MAAAVTERGRSQTHSAAAVSGGKCTVCLYMLQFGLLLGVSLCFWMYKGQKNHLNASVSVLYLDFCGETVS